jgi:hypothetical protein
MAVYLSVNRRIYRGKPTNLTVHTRRPNPFPRAPGSLLTVFTPRQCPPRRHCPPCRCHSSTRRLTGCARRQSGRNPSTLRPTWCRPRLPLPREASLPALPASTWAEPVSRPTTSAPRTPMSVAGLEPLPRKGFCFFNFVLNLSKFWMKIDYDRVILNEI